MRISNEDKRKKVRTEGNERKITVYDVWDEKEEINNIKNEEQGKEMKVNKQFQNRCKKQGYI